MRVSHQAEVQEDPWGPAAGGRGQGDEAGPWLVGSLGFAHKGFAAAAEESEPTGSGAPPPRARPAPSWLPGPRISLAKLGLWAQQG